MSDVRVFDGFPGISRGTAIPQLFFTAVLPSMKDSAELLAFLWALHITQAQSGEARFVSASEIWEHPAAQQSFAALASGFVGVEKGLAAGANSGSLLVLQLQGPSGDEFVYFVNNPPSRQAVMRARAGELTLRPLTVAIAPPPEVRPGIFRMYEEHIGTITPFVGERLLVAAEMYTIDWIERAFREAAELNVRNWRYVERTLERWAQEGRPIESTRRTPGETHALFASGRSASS